MYESFISSELQESSEILKNFSKKHKNLKKIEEAAILLSNVFKSGGKVLSCGNGGSYCDAIHFASELTGRYRKNRKGYPAISISDVSHFSGVSNDFGSEYVYSRYIESIGNYKDALLAISTSGNSKNIVNAVNSAILKKMYVISLTGRNGGEISNISDIEIRVPHFGFSDRIQEMHIKIIHILVFLIEKEMCRKL